ncbi:glycosyltransferase family 87 protein [Pontibacter korlensis]|uniref:DUF2029 domain-containing protein n=1 Tax=Pontibacter korlensis TaxID=400092 RepID=A0A0E3UXS6_9BACT|nr:glycosyltransferase family 87 protein [Pontibacter korlensis]AKD04502.1 hypothetical protein PKOR_17145 [Pontibacter korlensis]
MSTSKFFSSRFAWSYAILFAGILLLVGEIINGRFWMHDLEVYYRTAERMLNGSEIYRIESDGHYVYKYSPTAGMYFIPFIILPFAAAKIVFWLLLVLLAIVVLQTLYRYVSDGETAVTAKRKNIILLLSFLAVGAHIHREWHLGQVNFVLLALYVCMAVLWLSKKPVAAGVVLAATLFIKPFGLIFIPYLILKKKLSILLSAALAVVVLGLLPFILYPSAEAFTGLYQGWIQELLIEMSAKQELFASGNHTIFSVLARYTPIKFLLFNETAIKVYQLTLLACIAGFVLYIVRQGESLKQNILIDVAVLTALIPLFAFTSLNAFLFTLPCIVILLYYFPSLSTVAKILTVAGCVLIGINIRDLMGGDLYRFLERESVYTFGTVALLIAMTLLRLNIKKQRHNTGKIYQRNLAQK